MFGYGNYSPLYSPLYSPFSNPYYGTGMGMNYGTPVLQKNMGEEKDLTTFSGDTKKDTSAKIYGIGALAIAAAAIITHGKLSKVKGKDIEKLFDADGNEITGFWKRFKAKRAIKKAAKAEINAPIEAAKVARKEAEKLAKETRIANEKAAKEAKKAEEKLRKANRIPLFKRLFGKGKNKEVTVETKVETLSKKEENKLRESIAKAEENTTKSNAKIENQKFKTGIKSLDNVAADARQFADSRAKTGTKIIVKTEKPKTSVIKRLQYWGLNVVPNTLNGLKAFSERTKAKIKHINLHSKSTTANSKSTDTTPKIGISNQELLNNRQHKTATEKAFESRKHPTTNPFSEQKQHRTAAEKAMDERKHKNLN